MLFQYAHLAQDSIRLVQIHPSSNPADIRLTLSHLSKYFNSPAKYTAIWYPQTASSAERKTVTLNGRTRSVPLEVCDVLSAIREHHDRNDKYWIDAVCINQQDEIEKRAHIQQMKKIFSSANKIVLWLGAIDEAVEKAFPAVEACAVPTTEHINAARSIANWSAFVEVLRRPELQQEAAVMMSGRFTCRLEAFKDLVKRTSTSTPVSGRQSAGSL
ncbi:hypothetical protein M409DRAFT_54383 [Zasmidium cellare ATCC 36951]|uniref:Heterokaryon incompatibility domain-containing protein n=1 Tax=Zasmidium cellare ATCC 36951 TaxID=1080233 RepID=A0A6A6CJ75_ZASCE|nr:uncharacterized protein M409DRAFT_54383 [Zasmidium cellare ATCC 36951]KAF2167195.1 hypothetical protein M409DRAFT_54383 [Zasmidium cellare ATCC 36951]